MFYEEGNAAIRTPIYKHSAYGGEILIIKFGRILGLGRVGIFLWAFLGLILACFAFFASPTLLVFGDISWLIFSLVCQYLLVFFNLFDGVVVSLLYFSRILLSVCILIFVVFFLFGLYCFADEDGQSSGWDIRLLLGLLLLVVVTVLVGWPLLLLLLLVDDSVHHHHPWNPISPHALHPHVLHRRIHGLMHIHIRILVDRARVLIKPISRSTIAPSILLLRLPKFIDPNPDILKQFFLPVLDNHPISITDRTLIILINDLLHNIPLNRRVILSPVGASMVFAFLILWLLGVSLHF